jgi:hypothetical protein
MSRIVWPLVLYFGVFMYPAYFFQAAEIYANRGGIKRFVYHGPFSAFALIALPSHLLFMTTLIFPMVLNDLVWLTVAPILGLGAGWVLLWWIVRWVVEREKKQ